MYLDPRGEVRSCCRNEYHRLGNLADATLTEIWRGEQSRRLRDRIASGDYSLGCEQCGAEVALTGRSAAYPRTFDALEVESLAPGWPRQLELALSNACNLRCVMCNGDLSSAIRRFEGRPALADVYGDDFFEELDEFLPHLDSIVFLGGEPFLASGARRVMERLIERQLTPRCHVTTNATVWTGRIEALVRALPMHVAVSLDGVTASTNESIRVGTDHAKVLANIGRIRAAAGDAGWSLSFCLMRQNWSELDGVLSMADGLDVDVFVNMVSYPAPHSLFHAEDEELAAVVRAFEGCYEATRSRLGRNRAVWEQQVAALRTELLSRADAASGLGEVMVSIGSSPDETARLIVAERAGSPDEVAFVECGPDQVIRAASDGEYGLLNLSKTIGRPIWDVPVVLSDALGSLSTSHVEHLARGVELRRMEFDDGSSWCSVHAALAPTRDGGQRWYLTAVDSPAMT